MALRGDDEMYSLLSLMGGQESQSAVNSSSAATASIDKLLMSDEKLKSKKRKGDRHKRRITSQRLRGHGGDEGDGDGSPETESAFRKRITFADSRMIQNCHVWPRSDDGKLLLNLGSGLLHNNCDGYKVECGSDGIKHGSGELYGFHVCHSCGKSAVNHELCFSSSWTSDEITLNPLSILSVASIMVASRNIRCLIGEYYPTSLAKSYNGWAWIQQTEMSPPLNATPTSSNEISNAVELYLGRILSVVKRMQKKLAPTSKPHDDKARTGDVMIDSLASIPIVGDVHILQDKISALTKTVQDYCRTVVASSHGDNKNSTAINLVESRLAAMASCDFVYYRCYYEAVSSCISTDGAYDGTVLAAIFPHPPTYFSCPGLAWDIQNAGLASLRGYMGLCSDESKLVAPLDESCKQTLLKSWGLEERLLAMTLGSDAGSETNPLLTLWQSRFMETIRHVWSTRYSVVKLPVALNESLGIKALPSSSENTQLILHQTKALSPELIQWRDSIRDYPAHFYAYATPTTEAMNAVLNNMRNSNVHQVLEAGAGTGYWSALLLQHMKSCAKTNDSLVQVVPYDVAPPSSNVNEDGNCKIAASNEYHGHVPAFTDMLDSDSFREALSATTKSSAKTALLLCYPPPGSDMAQNALLSHMSNGGHTVIHIGECQGLTGDESFEVLLQQNFVCRETGVIPLPLWSTDATYLTIWKRKECIDLGKGVLSYSSAVGHCSVSECRNHARRRCRYARCIQYCSFDCYKKHQIPRRQMLAIHMIDARFDEILYEDDRHFMDLNEPNSDSFRLKRKKRKKSGH